MTNKDISVPRERPTMFERVTLEAIVNGYSENREGDTENEIVSLFVPDGYQTWGGHGPSGTTIWMSREQFDRLPKVPQ